MSNFKVHEQPTFLSLEFFVPKSSNAFSLECARELTKIQKKYAKWKKPVVVTSGHPTLFCSGGNLSDYKKLKTKVAGLKVNQEIQASLDRFGAWPVAKLAVIEGDALGGGMEWLGHFDLRWSTPYALFSFWQRRIGLSPGWGGGKIWSQKIGEHQLHKLLSEAELLSADHAVKAGVVDKVVSNWNIREMASEWARTARAPLKWSSSQEKQIFAKLWHGPEHKAILNKWRT